MVKERAAQAALWLLYRRLCQDAVSRGEG
jgi:hypothetical protein